MLKTVGTELRTNYINLTKRYLQLDIFAVGLLSLHCIS